MRLGPRLRAVVGPTRRSSSSRGKDGELVSRASPARGRWSANVRGVPRTLSERSTAASDPRCRPPSTRERARSAADFLLADSATTLEAARAPHRAELCGGDQHDRVAGRLPRLPGVVARRPGRRAGFFPSQTRRLGRERLRAASSRALPDRLAVTRRLADVNGPRSSGQSATIVMIPDRSLGRTRLAVEERGPGAPAPSSHRRAVTDRPWMRANRPAPTGTGGRPLRSPEGDRRAAPSSRYRESVSSRNGSRARENGRRARAPARAPGFACT